MKNYLWLALVLIVTASGLTAASAEAGTASRLPVREVTVFKDGHAYVVHEGQMPVNGDGEVVLDRLPAAVIGTFWAYSADPETKLVSVTARRQRTAVRRTALTLRELLEANVGAEASVAETNGLRYPATIVGFPARSPEELAATSPSDSPERLAQKGSLVLLKTADGVKALEVGCIQDVTFTESPEAKSEAEEFRPSLALKLEGAAGGAAATANVGLMYVQRGLRWIPSYRVELDGQGRAQVKLQATLLNELVDLEGATVHLVIGVPSFYFKETLDPMALQEAVAQLSSYFHSRAAQPGRPGLLTSNFSNSLMTQQVARMGDYAAEDGGGTGGGGPDLPEGTRNEDLFVFTLRNITLRKGERMILPVAEYSVGYEDVFVLDLPFAPPPELARNLNTDQQAELARLFGGPKVMHKARLQNRSAYPFTTAPALVLREGRVIAQGLMTYAAVGASTDLALTTAVDIQVKKADREIKRSPNVLHHNGDNYLRVDLSGTIRLSTAGPRRCASKSPAMFWGMWTPSTMTAAPP